MKRRTASSTGGAAPDLGVSAALDAGDGDGDLLVCAHQHGDVEDAVLARASRRARIDAAFGAVGGYCGKSRLGLPALGWRGSARLAPGLPCYSSSAEETLQQFVTTYFVVSSNVIEDCGQCADSQRIVKREVT
jgi:hypothetical protein